MGIRATLSVFALLFSAASADIYAKSSPVLQITGKTYDSLIAQSNYTSVLEFYAPWCGHCQNLKPAYEKVAKKLAGLAKVAAVNCDEDSNKPLCSQFSVQGFPTLKTIKPGPKPGRPIVEDYQGPRTAKAIVDAVVAKIPNHVTSLKDDSLNKWISSNSDSPKAILFTEKGTTSALIRSLAIDFLGVVDFAQIRNKETAAVEKYAVTTFPTLVLLPGENKDPLLYIEEMKKAPILAFMAQVATPNPDPAPKSPKPSKSSKAPRSAASSSKFSKASEAHKSEDLFKDLGDAGTIVLDENTPTESPIPIVPPKETPIAVPEVVPAIPLLATSGELEAACLSPKSGTCILILLPGSSPEKILPQSSTDALASSAELAHKHHKRKASIFPFYGIPSENEASKVIRGDLGLRGEDQLEIIAINVKRGWYRVHMTEKYDIVGLEGFVDGIRLGEGSKQSLPEGFYTSTTQTTSQNPNPAAPPSTDESTVEEDDQDSQDPIMHIEL